MSSDFAACPNGYYGTGCSQRCICQNAAKCDPLTGKCQCAPGWTGLACGMGEWIVIKIVFSPNSRIVKYWSFNNSNCLWITFIPLEIRTFRKTKIQLTFCACCSRYRLVPRFWHYHRPVPGFRRYHRPIPGFRHYHRPVPGFRRYHRPIPGFWHYNRPVPGFRRYHRPVLGIRRYHHPVLGFQL